MKLNTIILFAFLALSSALSEKVQLHESMENMMKMAMSANDAVDTVMKVLNDLRESVDDE